MHNPRSGLSPKTALVFLSACLLVLGCLGAVAQPPAPGGPGLERNDKAWEMEAKCVAQEIALSAELTTKLVDAYKTARDSYMTAAREAMGEGGQRDYSKIIELNKTQAAKLETALKGFLKPDQTTKAMASLGTFNRQWDRMVTVLDGMKLDEKANTTAMKSVTEFVVESGKVRQAAVAGGDFQSLREKTAPLREKLDADLAKVLSAEQVTKWKEETAMRRGGGGGGGRGPGQPPAPPAPPAAPAAPAAPPAAKPAAK